MLKVLFICGAPGTGKDCIAEKLSQYTTDCGVMTHHRKFASPVLDIAIAISRLSKEKFLALFNDRATKEIKFDVLDGHSPRSFVINTAEKIIKPVLGKDYFGKYIASTLKSGLTIITDGGFMTELRAIQDEVGKDNVTVVRLWRGGCTFEGDSRRCLYNSGSPERDVHNDLELSDAVRSFKLIINEMYKDDDKFYSPVRRMKNFIVP